MRRMHSNKRRDAHKFRRNMRRTKGINVSPGPMRGGIRL